jgi:hypothetical protein
MIIISNNVIGKMQIEPGVIVRVNLAWIPTKKEASELLSQIKNGIYLDFPSGRTKPPLPKIKLHEAMELCRQFKPKYFAISNAEDPKFLVKIKNQIPMETELVPKIETEEGVINFKNIVNEAGIKTAMLDKEDLYTNNQKRYELLVDLARLQAKEYKVKLLEMAGVIFI